MLSFKDFLVPVIAAFVLLGLFVLCAGLPVQAKTETPVYVSKCTLVESGVCKEYVTYRVVDN